jgi:hypothetical protein
LESTSPHTTHCSLLVSLSHISTKPECKNHLTFTHKLPSHLANRLIHFLLCTFNFTFNINTFRFVKETKQRSLFRCIQEDNIKTELTSANNLTDQLVRLVHVRMSHWSFLLLFPAAWSLNFAVVIFLSIIKIHPNNA